MDERITELEIRIAFQDDLLEELNKVVARQQKQIDFLMQEVFQVAEQVRNMDAPKGVSLRDEIPPHY